MSALPVTPPCEPPSQTAMGALGYRLLETGEIIQAGDELRNEEGMWRAMSGGSFGERLSNPNCVMRRPITGGAGLHEAATVSQAPPERAMWETLLMSLDREEGLKAEIEAAHAACDGPVSRKGTDGPRPLAERVSALRKMLAEAWRDQVDFPDEEEEALEDDDDRPVFVGIVCGAAGAIIGALLAWGFLALR